MSLITGTDSPGSPELPGSRFFGLDMRSDPAALEEEILDVITSWGATAHSEAAEVFRAASAHGRDGEQLDLLRRKARPWLPQDLAREVDALCAILAGGGSAANAPSLRARTADLLARASQALGAGLDERRAAMAAQIRPWLLLLDRLDQDANGGALEVLIRGRRCRTVAEQVAALEEIGRACDRLAAGGNALLASIEPLASEGAHGAEVTRTLQTGLEALRHGDPVDLYRSSATLVKVRSRAEHDAAQARRAASRARLIDLCRRLREGPMAGAGPDSSPADRVVMEALEATDALLRDDGLGTFDDEALEPALGSWEQVLTALLAAGPTGDGRRSSARQALAGALAGETERLARSLVDPAGGEASAAAREARAAAAALLEQSASSDASFQQALDTAMQAVRRARSDLASRSHEAARGLAASVSELASLLDKHGEFLPTARVLEARLLLEQADGLRASGQAEAIDAARLAAQRTLDELRQTAERARRHRASREDADREQLCHEARALEPLFTGRSSRALRGLIRAAEHARPDELQPLRERVERERAAIEQSIRLEAGRLLDASRRWLRKAGGRRSGPASESAGSLSREADGLAAAMEGDDLAGLRERTAGARRAFRQVSLLSRPGVRIGAALALCVLLAGGGYGWRLFQSRRQACVLELQIPAPQPAHIWVVRAGQIVARDTAAQEARTVRFDLPPGTYEIYVNGRYTGRVFQVPGAKRIAGVPFLSGQD